MQNDDEDASLSGGRCTRRTFAGNLAFWPNFPNKVCTKLKTLSSKSESAPSLLMCVSVNSRGGVRHACVCLGYLCVSSSVHRAAVCAGAESCHWLRVCARVSVSDKASVSSLSVCLAAGRTPAASGWIMKSRFFLRLLQDTCHQYLTQRKPDCRG